MSSGINKDPRAMDIGVRLKMRFGVSPKILIRHPQADFLCILRDENGEDLCEGSGLTEGMALIAAYKNFSPNQMGKSKAQLQKENADMEARLRDLESAVEAPKAETEDESADAAWPPSQELEVSKPVKKTRRKKTTPRSSSPE